MAEREEGILAGGRRIGGSRDGSSFVTRRLVLLAGLTAIILACPPAPADGSVREPILAGSWYPGEPQELRQAVESYLAGGSAKQKLVAALIVPHAGYEYSGPTAGKGFAAVRGKSYERVVLIGPTHHVSFTGAALPEEDVWRTPLGDVPLDGAAIASLAGHSGFQRLPAAHAREHCLEIQLPFLQVALKPGFRLVPMVIGQMDEDVCSDLAAAIEPLLGRKTLVVISSDFTHYGPNYDYVPFTDSVSVRLRRLDDEAVAAITRLSATQFQEIISRTGATICGAGPIRLLLTLLRDSGERVEKLGYGQSGAIMGDFTNSVSYVAMAFAPANEPTGGGKKGMAQSLNGKEQGFLLKLARDTIKAALQGSPYPSTQVPNEFGPDSPLREMRGVFVTLTQQERLRGCIGSIIGTEPLIVGVAHQAINAALHDPRFPALQPDELDQTHVEISVLTPPMPVAGPDDIVVGRHGVLLEKGGYHAVFLPQVAPEQGWDRTTMLRQLCRKAGLGPDEWKSGASFEVFEAQVFEEAKKPD